MNRLRIPKLQFKINKSLDEEMIFEFVVPDKLDDWSGVIYYQFPKLKEEIKGLRNKREVKNKVVDFVENYYRENKETIKGTKERFQRIADDNLPQALEVLSKVIQEDWGGIDKITAHIGINPISPRFLNSHSFQVGYKFSNKRMLGVALHEITHFLYFKKWKEVFPRDSKKTYEAPNLNWVLSEILAPVINSDSRIIKVAPFALTRGYSDHEKIMVEYRGKKCSIIDYFKYLYKDFKKTDRDFGDFLKEAKKEIKRLKTLFGTK